jgi:hypothetical protein
MELQSALLQGERAAANTLRASLTIQQRTLAEAQAQVARQQDTMRLMVAATNAARQQAQLLEREALVSSEIGNYHLDFTGRAVRRQVAETEALDSTAHRTIAMAEQILREMDERLRRSGEMERAVATVLCGNFAKESAEYRLRAAMDSALVVGTLCRADERSQPQRAGIVRQEPP